MNFKKILEKKEKSLHNMLTQTQGILTEKTEELNEKEKTSFEKEEVASIKEAKTGMLDNEVKAIKNIKTMSIKKPNMDKIIIMYVIFIFIFINIFVAMGGSVKYMLFAEQMKNDKVQTLNIGMTNLNTMLGQLMVVGQDKNINQNSAVSSSLYKIQTNTQQMTNDLSTILLSNESKVAMIDKIKNEQQMIQNGFDEINRMGIKTPDYEKANHMWGVISNQSDRLIEDATYLSQRSNGIVGDEFFNKLKSRVELIEIVIFGVIVLSYILSLTFLKKNYDIGSKNEEYDGSVNDIEKSQTSILRLLKEMMPLQDGDLTKKTTVTEDFTGAIADSINATIDSLTALVKKIKKSSLLMKEKTNEVSKVSDLMLYDIEKQAKVITETGVSVIGITDAIKDISQKTEMGAMEAQKTAKASEVGVEQVNASIYSMQEISSQMNETVFLMKKVGGSSAQISEIVGLLSDITEETSILSLNAAVQAAKAGEAGKSFKVVSNSIQELADKAGEATRRVGALISAVQTDIQAVEVAIKKTTEEVGKGVALSEKAGGSLNDMRDASQSLSLIVKEISTEAKEYAVLAQKVSEDMRGILETTEKTKTSTQKAVNSIGEILNISNELGESVQSFKIN